MFSRIQKMGDGKAHEKERLRFKLGGRKHVVSKSVETGVCGKRIV